MILLHLPLKALLIILECLSSVCVICKETQQNFHIFWSTETRNRLSLRLPILLRNNEYNSRI